MQYKLLNLYILVSGVFIETFKYKCIHYMILNTKMATTISVRLDKALLRDLSEIEKNWQADRSEAIRRLLAKAVNSWKIHSMLEKMREHKISIGKAAEKCGLSVWEMLDIVKENNINWTGYSKEDLERDIRILEGKA